MLALGWVYLCCHSGLSTLYWPHLPLTLAYVGPMVAYVSLFWPYLPLMLAHVDPMRTYVGAMRHEVGSIYVGPRLVFWPYLPLMLAHVDPMRTYVGAMRPQVGSIYVGPRLGLSMLSLRSVNPILAPSPPYVGLCWPYVCQPYIGPISPLCWPMLALW